MSTITRSTSARKISTGYPWNIVYQRDISLGIGYIAYAYLDTPTYSLASYYD